MSEPENPDMPDMPEEGLSIVHMGPLMTAEPDSTSRYFAQAMARLHLTDWDILQLAGERGLAPGVLGSRAIHAAQGSLTEQYQVNQAAMLDMGFTRRQMEDEAPSFDEVVKRIGGLPTLMALGRRSEFGHQDNLMVLPNVRKIGLMGSDRNPGFIPRYNRKEGLATKVRGFAAEWLQVVDKGIGHDRRANASSNWIVALMMDGAVRRPASGSGVISIFADTQRGERGLRYQGLTADEQREILKADQEVNEFEGIFALGAAGAAHYIVRNAQLRVLGQALLDDREQNSDLDTFTSFIDHPYVKVGGKDKVLGARTYRGQIELGSSPANERFPGGGIREVLQAVESPAKTKQLH
ncbi:MAG: hypothetical protein ACHQT9_03495 [Candidatus Saccharimonadales bacterium]